MPDFTNISMQDYNYTIGFVEVIRAVNDASNDWFIRGMLLATFFILLMWIYRMDREFLEAASASIFVVLIATIFLRVGDLIDVQTLITVIALAIIFISWMAIDRKSSSTAT